VIPLPEGAITTVIASRSACLFSAFREQALYRARVDVLENFFARRIAKQRIEGGVEQLFVHQLHRLQGR
jgi:hypothetical protein